MARFNVTLNVTELTFINGQLVEAPAQRDLGHQLGTEQGVASVADAKEWLDFVIIGGRFTSADGSYAYVVNSAVVTAA